MRILLVEDEKSLALIIKKGLEENGYSVDMAHDGEEGLFMAENYSADVIVLDVMLPIIGGFKVLEKMRDGGIKTPVLMLTAKDTLSDKIEGLDRGADDYLTKPFDFDELLARLRALIRRASEVKESVIRVADLEIDTASHTVRRGGKPIILSAKEYALLEYMAYHRDEVVSRFDITEHIYNEDFDRDSNVVDVYINYLRKKIDQGFDKKLIHTVRGAGYILKSDV